MEAIHAAPRRAGLLDGLVEADPTLVAIVVAVFVVSAVLYVVFGMRKRG